MPWIAGCGGAMTTRSFAAGRFFAASRTRALYQVVRQRCFIRASIWRGSPMMDDPGKTSSSSQGGSSGGRTLTLRSQDWPRRYGGGGAYHTGEGGGAIHTNRSTLTSPPA